MEVTRKIRIRTARLYNLPPRIVQIEGWCWVPITIIRQQFSFSWSKWPPPTSIAQNPKTYSRFQFTPYQHHTLGRGPGSMVTPLLPQGVRLLPAAGIKCHAGCLLRAGVTTSSTCNEAGLGMTPSFPREIRQRTQPRPIIGEQLHRFTCWLFTSRHKHNWNVYIGFAKQST